MKEQKDAVQGNLFPEYGLEPVSKPRRRNFKVVNEENKQLTQTIESLRAEIASLKKENSTLLNKAKAFDELEKCENLFPIGTIAKSFGYTAEWMNKYLADKGVQFKRQGDIWKLYAKYDSCGYTGVGWYPYAKDAEGRDLVRAHTYWTIKGMAFIRELLIADGLWKK